MKELPLPWPDLAAHDAGSLERLHDAAGELLDARAALASAGETPVSAVLAQSDSFIEWDHYPAGDAEDRDSGGLYYYHAHAADERAPGEHGHFHLFLKPHLAGLSPEPDARPGNLQGPAAGADKVSHLVAISMTAHGEPMRLFTTNRWVCDETWYPAETVRGFLDHFRIGRGPQAQPLDQWLDAMIRLFRPQIEILLDRREEVLGRAEENGRAGAQVLENRDHDILAQMPVNIATQICAIERRLGIEPGS